MKVIGIDPGTRILGYGVVESNQGRLIAHAYGAVRTKATDSISTKLKFIYHNLNHIITQHKPDVLALEKVFYGKNIQSAIRIGEARGVVLMIAALAGLEVFEYDATKIKKAAVGQGQAHKSQVQFMMKAMLGLDEIPTPEDAADALAIAVSHCHNVEINALRNS